MLLKKKKERVKSLIRSGILMKFLIRNFSQLYNLSLSFSKEKVEGTDYTQVNQ